MNKGKGIIAVIFLALLVAAIVSGCSKASNGGVTNPPSQPQTPAPQTPVPTGENPPAQENDPQKQLLNEIMQSARQGKVINCEFTAGKTVFEDVEKKWGKPGKVDYVPEAGGRFATYPDRGFVFGINKGEQVFDIRSYDSRLKEIPLSKVKEVLGPPDMERNYAGEDIIGYKAGTEFKIRLIFPEVTGQNPDPKLDHISVFYPRGTVNYMSENTGLEW